MGLQKLVVGIALLLIVPLPVQAASNTDAEVDQLRAQVEELNRRYEEQGRLLAIMEQRLQQMEASAQSRDGDGAAAPVQTAHQVPAAGPPQQQAQAPVPAEAPPQPQPPAAAVPGTPDGDETVREPPPARSVEAVLREEHALFAPGRFTLEPGFTYARSDRRRIDLSGFLALDAIFLGRISVDEVKADILTFDLTGRYGLTNRLQLDINVPFIYRSTTFESGGVGGVASVVSDAEISRADLGDINVGIFYHAFRETTYMPDVVLNLRGKAPTGKDPYGIKLIQPDPDNDNLLIPEDLPTGNGVWTLAPGFSLVKTLDPAVFFANFSYFYNFQESVSDLSTVVDERVPGRVDLGNSYQFGVGMAYALSERMSMSFSYNQRLTESSRLKPQGQGWQTIVGSDANSATFNIGLTLALAQRFTMVTNVGIGLTDDAPDVQFTMRFPYMF